MGQSCRPSGAARAPPGATPLPCPCHLERWPVFFSWSFTRPAIRTSASFPFNRCPLRRHRPFSHALRPHDSARCKGQQFAPRSRSFFGTHSARWSRTDYCRPFRGLECHNPILAETQRLSPAPRRPRCGIAEAPRANGSTDQRGSGHQSDHEVVFTLALGDRFLEPFRPSPLPGPGDCGVVRVDILRNAF